MGCLLGGRDYEIVKLSWAKPQPNLPEGIGDNDSV